jgi:hypothetical protein
MQSMPAGPRAATTQDETSGIERGTQAAIQPPGLEIGRVVGYYQDGEDTRFSVITGRSGYHMRPSTVLLPLFADIAAKFSIEILIDI